MIVDDTIAPRLFIKNFSEIANDRARNTKNKRKNSPRFMGRHNQYSTASKKNNALCYFI